MYIYIYSILLHPYLRVHVHSSFYVTVALRWQGNVPAINLLRTFMRQQNITDGDYKEPLSPTPR